MLDRQDFKSIDMDSMRDQIEELEGEHQQEPYRPTEEDDYMMDQEFADTQTQNGQLEEEEDDVDITELLHVVDAFDMPQWAWATDIKTFTKVDPVKRQQEIENGHHAANGSSGIHSTRIPNQILGLAEEKTAMFRARYHVLLQRIMRNECFAPPVFTGGMEQDRYLKLTPLKALKGRCGERFLMFGMLVQMSGGKYCLEDADDRVELVLDHSVSLHFA